MTTDPDIAYGIENGLIYSFEKHKKAKRLEDELRKILDPYGIPYQPIALEQIIELNKLAGKSISKLEKLLDLVPRTLSQDYKPSFETKEELSDFLKRTERVIEVDYLHESFMGRVLGMFDPNSDTIYVLRNIPAHVKRFVLAHERAHRRRRAIGESQNEYLVDLEAAAEVGFDPLQRFNFTGYRRAA